MQGDQNQRWVYTPGGPLTPEEAARTPAPINPAAKWPFQDGPSVSLRGTGEALRHLPATRPSPLPRGNCVMRSCDDERDERLFKPQALPAPDGLLTVARLPRGNGGRP
jgi:hypothetical protein